MIYPASPECVPPLDIAAGRYTLRFAGNRDDLDRVLQLRFRVFNLELGEGLDEAYRTGRDVDELDASFHHLMIVCRTTGNVVGTYRMQTSEMATRLGGFYSAGEFDLSTVPLNVMRHSIEIGRACVARDHRNGRVLHLLWRGLAAYLAWNQKRYLFGCCSLTSQDPALGLAVFEHLERGGHLDEAIRVSPLARTECILKDPSAAPPPFELPPLFESYLHLGARVCGPPAIDRLFKTIDFLVALDTEALEPSAYRSFFR
ncbi:MAG: GNAT family N-acyltransferase [Gemmatimonadota bacterium]